MTKKPLNNYHSIPLMSAQIGFYAWETIARRTVLMLSGNCSAAEYQRMFTEKATAVTASAAAITRGDIAESLAPWHDAVQGNARRLRGKS